MEPMRRIVMVVMGCLALCTNAQQKQKISCVGASITYGAFLGDRTKEAFPAQLQQLLGTDYEVENFGVNGTTMSRSGDNPYWKTPAYKKALKSKPDVVLIDLGGNDSKVFNRIKLQNLLQDSRDMIQSFQKLSSHPRVIVLLPVVSFVTDTTGIWDPAIRERITPQLREAAYLQGVELLDMRPLLVNHPEMFADKIHPNAEGAGIMAQRIYEVLTQPRDNAFDIRKGLLENADVESFLGYPMLRFELNGRECRIAMPKKAAKGHPYIWRARFWGHEPQTDVALLERGYHVIYCDAAELFGNSEAVALWNTFYDMVHKAGLAPKGAMEGMSRGAVYVLNWAAQNPDKVASVYIDNPLLDMKSWPLGLGVLDPAGPELEAFKKDYNIWDQVELEAFKNSPMNKIDAIVAGNYPILILCADADEAAIPQENTIPFEKKIKSAGGDIQVYHKPGFGHHPHSLPNPKPILDFILQHQPKAN